MGDLSKVVVKEKIGDLKLVESGGVDLILSKENPSDHLMLGYEIQIY